MLLFPFFSNVCFTLNILNTFGLPLDSLQRLFLPLILTTLSRLIVQNEEFLWKTMERFHSSNVTGQQLEYAPKEASLKIEHQEIKPAFLLFFLKLILFLFSFSLSLSP